MPCKKGAISQASSSETGAKNDESGKGSKTQYDCIVEAHEFTRQRLESSLPKHHDDHIASKGYNSIVHYNLVHKFIPMPLAMKTLDAKAAVDKERKKLEAIPAWKLEKVQRKKEVIKETQKNNNKVHFASLMDLCHLKNSD